MPPVPAQINHETVTREYVRNIEDARGFIEGIFLTRLKQSGVTSLSVGVRG